MDDQKIVAQFLARDERAIAQTAKKYGARLRAIALGILGDACEAEECENDTYMAAWNSIPPHTPHSYLFAYLGQITRNLSIDRCRRQKRQRIFCELTQEMAECLGANDVETAANADALLQTIHAFLQRHPSAQRNVFVRRYWFFDSIAEISKRYGYSQSKVKTMLFRMRQELHADLQKEGFLP